ncbi:CTP synthetase [Sulfolobales archaeon HS-7]|nr:CTP synthetase [Sulfolobales archaeon HS-7]
MGKYIFITGGVLSSIGKGTITSSLGFLLKSAGFKVTAVKIDPYVNVDAGTMNPYMHGEVFVTNDGAETDLDLGHYERFIDIEMTKINNITTGKVYFETIRKEREGKFLGQTVQIIPHITDEIKSMIRQVTKLFDAEITIVEIGGTVGDIESLPFLEATRQMKLESEESDVLFIHTALVEYLKVTGELKTKPLQHSVQELRRIGIQPDIIITRSPFPIDEESRDKISLFTNVRKDKIFTNYDVDTPYEVPMILNEQNIIETIIKLMGLPERKPDITQWINFVEKIRNPSGKTAKIFLIGKYTKHKDSYISIKEAMLHAAAYLNVKLDMVWLESNELEKGEFSILNDAMGIVVLPGFGSRGVEGKINAIKYARTKNIPFLGICFGLQLAVVEFARNVLNYTNANTTEVDQNTPYPVISMLDEQKKVTLLGGTMRLGAQKIILREGTKVWEAYGRKVINERHRHRYEVNPRFVDEMEKNGFIVSGVSEDGLVEMMELKGHKFFVGTQPHPEFNSRPMKPAPLFINFLRAVIS